MAIAFVRMHAEYDCSMDPVSACAAVSAVLALVDWKKAIQSLATDAVSKSARGVLGLLKRDEREKAAKQVLELFVAEFLGELLDKTPLSSAVAGYRDQLKRLIEHAAPEITDWLQPETKEVDLAPIERMWNGLGLDPLPEDFDWSLVAKNYARDLRGYVKSDPALREMLNTALLEKQTELQQESAKALARVAGVDVGFDLSGYRDHLRKKCGVLQLAAMHTSTYDRRINLWNIFVPQSARQSAPVRDLPRELLRRLRREGHLTGEHDEIEIARLREVYQGSPVGPVLDILTRERLVVVLGDPGSGKTSLLKFLVMQWASQEPGTASLLPIWIDLKEYAKERNGLVGYCESGSATFRLDARKVDELLKGGKAAIYLDGLDEIFDGPTRGSVIEEIAAFAARYTQAPVVVTSRVVGYEADRLGNAGFAHATLEDFDDEQVLSFVGKWHDVAEEDANQRSRLQRQLQSALRESRAVRELAGNPLLLTMMAILNRTQALPRNRVELYAQASRVLLHEWDASRSLPVDTFARQEKEELLRELAGVMQQQEPGLAGNLIDRSSLVELFRRFLKNLGILDFHDKATSLVRQLTERNFILCFAGADRFSFVHRTFLEYFCAAWFVELFEKKQTLTLQRLTNDVFGLHWNDESWHEVLRLIAGMVAEKQAEQLILFLIRQDGRNHRFANLMLAAGCLSEVRNRRLIRNTDEELLRAFTQRAIRYDPPYYYEPYLEYSETGVTRERAVALIAFVWRSGKVRAWLRSATENDRDWIVRRAALRELARGWKDDPETLPMLKDRVRSDENIDVRRAVIQELARGWKDDPETLPMLKDCVRSDENIDVRRAAIQELARGWKGDPGTLPWLKDRARSDEDIDVRWKVVRELAGGWKDDPETLLWLKDRARSDENHIVRMVAVEELARGWKDDPETLPILKDRARSDEDDAVRWAALEELARGWKEDPETLPWLKDRARSEGHYIVRMTALQELARGWKDNSETLPWLKDSARSDEDNAVRRAAVEELARGWKDHPETLPILKDCARSDEDEYVRGAAVQELARGWKDDPETLPMLKERARSDEDNDVRIAVVRALARGWKDDPETLPMLKDRARSDEANAVRRTSVRELARGWKDDPETLPILKERARSDEDNDVRRAAAEELARGWKDDPEAAEIVRSATGDAPTS